MNQNTIITSGMRLTIGVTSEPKTYKVERNSVLKFAKAIGDINPYYSNNRTLEEIPEHEIIVPATFSRTMRPSPSNLEFDPGVPGVLDAGSTWQYLAPIHINDDITVSTKLVDLNEKVGSLGKMLLAGRETTYTNQHNTLVLLEHDTEIYYDNRSTPDAYTSTRSSIKQGVEKLGIETCGVDFGNVSVGSPLPKLIVKPPIRQLVMYAGASGDFYEIHYDRDFANHRGLREIIVHGALKAAFLGQLVTNWVGDNGTLTKLSAQYRKMDARDDKLICTGIVNAKRKSDIKDVVDCTLWVENAWGEKTTYGTATITIS